MEVEPAVASFNHGFHADLLLPANISIYRFHFELLSLAQKVRNIIINHTQNAACMLWQGQVSGLKNRTWERAWSCLHFYMPARSFLMRLEPRVALWQAVGGALPAFRRLVLRGHIAQKLCRELRKHLKRETQPVLIAGGIMAMAQ